MTIFQYEAKVPASVQWQAGIQKTLPWASVVDVSYVGNHGYNRLGGFQGGTTVNLNAIDFGAAYLPQNQDPTLGPSTVPGANALLDEPAAAVPRVQQHQPEHDGIRGHLSLDPVELQPPVPQRVLVRRELRAEPLVHRQHRPAEAAAARGGRHVSVRADQADYEELNRTANLQRHLVKANWVWDLPTTSSKLRAASSGAILNDWQVSGLFTAGSGNRYDLNYSYNTRRQREPHRLARLRRAGSSTSAILAAAARATSSRSSTPRAVAGPSYNSVGLESGRNYMLGCPDNTMDLAIARNIRFGGSRQLQLRLDAYNAVQHGDHHRSSESDPVQQPDRPDDPQSAVRREAGDTTLAPGATGTVLNSARLAPKDAGFGAATGAQNMRNLQLQIRFQF